MMRKEATEKIIFGLLVLMLAAFWIALQFPLGHALDPQKPQRQELDAPACQENRQNDTAPQHRARPQEDFRL